MKPLSCHVAGVLVVLLVASCSTGVDAADAPPAAVAEFFERQVRPLLAEKCYSCHGRGQRKGGLSLDHQAGVLAGGESGAIVVSGKPSESLLIEAVRYTGDVQMPPDAPLSQREIAILEQWVALGVPWPESSADAGPTIRGDGQVTDADRQFWSLLPIREPTLPPVKQTSWPRQPIDFFILARLEAEGLAPAAEADRRTWLRRASFDLLGLPPSEAALATFLADQQPGAEERALDRLLHSPEYGERWGRHWLDVARYGEDQAHTFQARLYPQGFRYRDWVIQSLNGDLPIDQFLLEQIAGDLISGADRMQRLPALGFFALGPVYYADAGCAPKAKSDEYDDRIDTLSRGMLGLTVSCARCHDHKFDPITTHDYYALAGVFSSSDYLEAPLAPPEVVAAYDQGQELVKQAEQRVQQVEQQAARELGERFAADAARYLMAVWRTTNARKADPKSPLSRALMGSDLHEFLAARWLAFVDAELGQQAPLLAPWRMLVSQQDASRDLTAEAAAVRDAEQAAAAVQAGLLAALEERRAWEAQQQAAAATPSAGDKDAGKATEKPKLPAATARTLNDFLEHKNAPLAIPKDRWEKFLSSERLQSLAELKKEVEKQKQAAPPKYPVAHSLAEGRAANSHVHRRGNVKDLGEEVPRRFLTALSGTAPRPFTQGSGRLELAQAIVDRQNPLTARVFVNRVWQHHFGRGIVGTPSNFGLLGERPTHPELLDYLAARFIATGWSLKELHRELMLSATYRQASTGGEATLEHDPDNRLLGRMTRRRLEIESWRDALLAASGNLDGRIGGPSIPLQASGNRRRTMYAAISRHDLHPMLRLFDFPDPNLTSERRSQTMVPMQQLFVLNSDFMVEQARALVARLKRDSATTPEARLERLYAWLFGRSPEARERQLGLTFLQQEDTRTAGASEPPFSRWEQYAQALLSTNEFLFVD